MFKAEGKEILKGEDHFADACDNDAAIAIVAALNAPHRIAAHLDAEADRRPRARAFARGIRYAADEVRARFWEADAPAPEGERARYSDDNRGPDNGTAG